MLEESENRRHPLLERLRFLSISASNLDEFYMVRIAGLKGQVREGVRVVSQDGLEPRRTAHPGQRRGHRVDERPEPHLAHLARRIGQGKSSTSWRWEGITAADRTALGRGVHQPDLFPVLTPLAVDPAHPFPFLPNLAFALALKLKRASDGKSFFALVPMPNGMRRFWQLHPGEVRKSPRADRRYVPIETLVALSSRPAVS